MRIRRDRLGPFRKQPEAHDKPESLRGYLSLTAIALSAYPIYYGILTFIFGDRLWKPERSAFGIPWAPESVGAIMVVFGVLTILVSSNRFKLGKRMSWCMYSMTLMWGIFAATFLIDAVQGDSLDAYPPLGVYLLLAILCAARATLEDQWRT